MEAFFENNEEKQNLSVFRCVEHSWPTHFHANIELFIVKRGSYDIMRNGELFTMTENQIAFFDHYDLHSYKNNGKIGDDCVIIIPMPYSEPFDATRKGNATETVITNAALTDKILAIADDINKNKGDKYLASASIGYILALLRQHFTFTRIGAKLSDETEYIRKLLVYINEHFKEDISSTTLARHIGYSREYTSKLFNKYMKESIPHYVNKIRANYVSAKKDGSAESLTALILDAGFNHPSTYYRFLQKQTPADDE